MSTVIRASAVGRISCRICGLVSLRPKAAGQVARCPRCDQSLHARVPGSTKNTLAWLIAGVILYIPANVLPVMYINGIGGGEESTILEGVLGFWRSGAWGVALLIFTASVAVPATKFLALGLLLWTSHRESSWARRQRTALFRLIELIGYWSMLDVVVVAMTAVLLRFEGIGTAEPRLGIVFFCAVVVSTMASAMSFDPRLIWDAGARDAS
jgi:paraquat-inducible protein A